MELVLRLQLNVQLQLVQKNPQLGVKTDFVLNPEMLVHHSLMINNNVRVAPNQSLLVLMVLALTQQIIVNQSSGVQQIKLDVQMVHADTYNHYVQRTVLCVLHTNHSDAKLVFALNTKKIAQQKTVVHSLRTVLLCTNAQLTVNVLKKNLNAKN